MCWVLEREVDGAPSFMLLYCAQYLLARSPCCASGTAVSVCWLCCSQVAELMAAELGWGRRQTKREVAAAYAYLQTFKV